MSHPRNCRVSACDNHFVSNDNIIFFSFPKNQVEAAKWRANLKIPALEELPTRNAYVCKRHFEESALGTKKLKVKAVPTLYLGYDETPPYAWKSPPPRRKFCIDGCTSTCKSILYKFPTKEDDRKQWALACNIKVSATDVIFICQRHFLSQYVSRFTLLKGAFPCLNLGSAARSRSPSIAHSAGSEWKCLPVEKVYTPYKDREFFKDEVDEEDDEFNRVSQVLDVRTEFCENECNVDSEDMNSRERFAKSASFYRGSIRELNKKIEELQRENRELREQFNELKFRAIVADESASSDAVTFARMIVTKSIFYSANEKALAQNIRYMSTKTYNFMRDALEFALPSKSSLLRWRPLRYVAPGLDANVLLNLSNTVDKMSFRNRQCVILFDES